MVEYKLTVHDFPIRNVGDEMFFGFPVAIGVHPTDWITDNECYAWCDFFYGNGVTRYKIPSDKKLINKLYYYIQTNMLCATEGDCGTTCKVWISKTKNGYEVDLP